MEGLFLMDIMGKIDQYALLIQQKEQLADATKANNIELETVKQELYAMMVDADCASISRNGFRYSLQAKTCYGKIGDEKLQEAEIDFFEVLREEGLGDIIKETVNPRTLQSTMKAYVEENGALSEELAECISVYDTFDIAKRKETNKALKN